MLLASVQPSPRPLQAPGNEACDSRGVKPKGCLNHPGAPGEAKIGRVNASELLMRLRYDGSPESMVDQDGDVGSMKQGRLRPCLTRELSYLVCGHQDPGVQEAPTPIVSHWYETRQSRCGLGESPVGPTIFGRKAELHSGDMKVQEAKAACRKARGIHNLADRVIWPEPKGC